MSTHAAALEAPTFEATAKAARNPLRVAILGASGIGKNHARWFAKHGCEVRAFLGSSSESIGRTRALLQRDSGFAGRAYSDLRSLLRLEKPDAVCIATPPALHYSQTLQCLDAGAHVLCEKPLVGDESLSVDELIRQAQHLECFARERGLLLETQTQYGQIAQRVLTMCGIENPTSMRQWTMEMETKNIVAGRDYERIWLDLSPHPISLLLALNAQINWDSVFCMVCEQGSAAEFQVRFDPNQGATCLVRIGVRVNPKRAVPLRRIAVDEHYVDYSAGKNASGAFRNYLTSDDGTVVELDDLVDSLIGDFVARVTRFKNGTPNPSDFNSNHGSFNVEWQLKILQKAHIQEAGKADVT